MALKPILFIFFIKFNYANYVKTDFIAEKLIEWANMHSATLYKLTLME